MRKILLFLLCFGLIYCAEFEDLYKIAVDERGDQYVADTFHNVVKKIDTAGNVTIIKYDLDHPQAVAVQGNTLYVLDTGNNRICKFKILDGEIRFQKSFAADLRYPRDVDLSPDGKYLYILDSGHNKVVRYILGEEDKRDLVFGDLNMPYGLCVDPFGFIYVADTGSHRIVKYGPDGRQLQTFGREGKRKGEFLFPKDVVVGFSRQIIVADSGNNRIQRLAENGHYLNELKVSGKELTDVRGLALDLERGQLYISNAQGIEKQNLGFNIKSAVVENEYFSPNGDGIKDYAIFKAELLAPSDLALEIYKDNELVERLEGPKNALNFQKIYWKPEGRRSGEYLYYFYCADSKTPREPYVKKGRLHIDLDPPNIEEFQVSPNILSPDGDGIEEETQLTARCNEPAVLAANVLFKGPKGEEFFVNVQGGNLRENPLLIWNGRNRFLETKNGNYILEFWAIDAAGNKSGKKRADILISIEHPIIYTAKLTEKMIKENGSVSAVFTLLREANVEIILKDLSGKVVRTAYSGTLSAAEHNIKLDLKGIKSSDYTVLIKASSGKAKDEYYNGLVIDSRPPAVLELSLSKQEMWSGGIDKTRLSFKVDETAKVKIYLRDAGGKTVTVLKENDQVDPGEEYEIYFNGLDEKERSIPAGEYTLAVEVQDLVGNKNTVTHPLNLTATGPEILDVLQSSDIMSVNGEGSYRLIEFRYNLQKSLGDLFVTLKIFKNGELIETVADRQRRLRGLNYDYWYAKSDLPEGIYQYDLTVQDEYQHTYDKTGEIYVVEKRPSVLNYSLSEPAISPANQDSIKDTTSLHFTTKLSEILSLYDNKEEKTIKTPTKVKVKIDIGSVRHYETIENDGEHEFLWDGKDDSGQYVKDDVYSIQIYALDMTGAQSDTITLNIVVANSREKITYYDLKINNISATPADIFDPYTGANTVTLNYGVGYFPVDQTMQAFVYSSSGILLKTLSSVAFTGSGNYTAVWDGITDSGANVNDGSYEFRINIKDAAGNDFTYTTVANNVPSFNYSDDIQVTSPDGTLYSKTSITNSGGNIEVNYVKGNPYAYIDDNLKKTNIPPYHDKFTFCSDYYQVIEWGRDFIVSDADLTIRNSAGDDEVIIDIGDGSAGLSTGNKELTVWSTDSGSVYWFKFYRNDVWYKNINILNIETQVDPGLNVEGVLAEARLQRLGLIRLEDSNSKVLLNSDTVYYKRKVGTSATDWIQISQTGKICSEPSITQTVGNESYVSWIQRDTVGGDPYVVAQKIPELFYPVEADPKSSIFGGVMNAGVQGGNFTIMSTTPDLKLIAPEDNGVVPEGQPTFVWEAPTWAVMTSTNYDLSISPGNDQFSDADDILDNLLPAQLSFSGVTNGIVSYTLPVSQKLKINTYYWKVGAKDAPAAPIRAEASLPFVFNVIDSLSISGEINYPNPFQGKTTIRYKLTQDADVVVRIYNLTGLLVKSMEYGSGLEGGKASTYFDEYNDVVWDGTNDFGDEVVNGAYVYEINAEADGRKVKVRGKSLKWR